MRSASESFTSVAGATSGSSISTGASAPEKGANSAALSLNTVAGVAAASTAPVSVAGSLGAKGRDGAAEGTGKKKKNSKSKRKKNRGETKEQNNRESLPAMIRMPLEQIKAGGKLSYDKKLRTQRRQKSSLLFVAFENELVFDAFNPTVFVRWSNSVKQTTKLPTVLAPESSSSSTVVALASLAPELVAVIANCLTGEELTECAAVCRLFAGVVEDPLLDASLWGRLLARDFPRDAVSNTAKVCSFKKLYLLCQEDRAMLEANVGFGNC